MFIKTKPTALAALILGFLTWGLLVFIIIKSGGVVRPAEYPNEQGFRQAIFFFELAADGSELLSALGDPATETGKAIRSAMDTTNKVDFFFMTCYSLFFAVLFVFLLSLNRSMSQGLARAFLIAGIVLSAFMLVSDILETRVLLALSAHPNPGDMGQNLMGLHLWTRLKFVSINIACIFLAFLYLRYFGRRVWGFVFAGIYGIAAIIGIISTIVFGLRFIVEFSANLGGLGWLCSAIHAGIVYFGKPIET
ncbi:MAG: hypothetical protein JXA30_04860 [Deltaproteobacteria bacterium]|nr:hypothetical protein [Deltaproteobacteria bacterium]